MDVIPAIDILDGRCVRLYQGDYQQSEVFGEDPVEVAQRWYSQGAKYLHVVDLDGAKAGKPKNLKVIEAIARSIPIRVQVGGGLRDRKYFVSATFWCQSCDCRHGGGGKLAINRRDLCRIS